MVLPVQGSLARERAVELTFGEVGADPISLTRFVDRASALLEADAADPDVIAWRASRDEDAEYERLREAEEEWAVSGGWTL